MPLLEPQPQRLSRPDGTDLAVYQRDPIEDTADVSVVFVHGWQASARVWNDVLSRTTLDGRLRVVTYDQRGHGASTHGRAPADISVLARDLAAVLRAHAADLPVVLAGHSMGAMTVMMHALLSAPVASPQVAGVLLASPSSGRLDLRRHDQPALTRALGSARSVIASACATAPRPVQYLRNTLRPSHEPRPPLDVAAAWYRAILSYDVSGSLDALANAPVHLVTGAQDRLIPPIHTCRLAAELPHARVHVAEGAGHGLPGERPDLVADLLRELVTGARTQLTLPGHGEGRSQLLTA
ncbi:alpha/beta fold hydrolase (plasmid) [Streptomyces sp. NBC_01298]|uniref:alpha/beta fold hydrolase n=1 Tax=Streptomyces sp. NBC_01298 TaxID=2903817 RepID=UPI002E11BB11|nr:alpha/beta fold hydrolase [Streptomyces sp. NBC_01298]